MLPIKSTTLHLWNLTNSFAHKNNLERQRIGKVLFCNAEGISSEDQLNTYIDRDFDFDVFEHEMAPNEIYLHYTHRSFKALLRYTNVTN